MHNEDACKDIPMKSMRIAVIGTGAFGTAMATACARNNHAVTLVARDQAVIASINSTHVHPKFLPEIPLLPNITCTADVATALIGVDFIILALPAQIVSDWLETHKHLIHPETLICNTAKGLHLKSRKLLSVVIRKVFDREQPYAILSGPSFAKEIVTGQPTAVVCASKFLYDAVTVQRAMSNKNFRVYTSQDVIGVELGGALKNPLAIGAGMIEGMGLGINSMAAFVTRSSLELQQLCKAMGGEPQTISGLSGVGDLMLTAFGDLSRNRTCGKRFAQGESIENILRSATVEGVPTAEVAVVLMQQCGLDLPIFTLVHALLKGKVKIEDAHGHLFGRPLGQEITGDMKWN
jgi:glycerol-3-phosphate dehydrogenase (NAD+)